MALHPLSVPSDFTDVASEVGSAPNSARFVASSVQSTVGHDSGVSTMGGSSSSAEWRRPPPAKVTCDAIHAYCLSSSFCLRNT